MDELNTTVEMQQMESVLDDAVQAPEETSEPISSVVEAEPKAKEQPSQPGWIKGRIEAAVRKATAELTASYESRINQMQESIWEREARDLVDSGEFKSVERAKEYLQLKSGAHVAAEKPAPARDEQGRFARQTEDPVTMAKAEVLAGQAQRIKAKTGMDVMTIYKTDPDVQQKIISGEWDFYDVAEQYEQPRRRVPVPARSANGSQMTDFSVKNMSDADFARLDEMLSSGRRFNMRK